MALLSPKEVVDKIIETVNTNMPDHFVSVEYTGIVNQDNLKAKDFPKLYLFINDNQTFGENSNSFVLDMRAFDLMTGREEEWQRDLEIKSDLFQSLSILFDLLEKDDVISGSISISPQTFTAAVNNGLSGYSMSVTFPLAKPCAETVTQ